MSRPNNSDPHDCALLPEAAHFEVGKHGARLLIYGGNRYYRINRLRTKTTWLCCKYHVCKCKAKVSTNIEEELVVQVIQNAHNHGAPPAPAASPAPPPPAASPAPEVLVVPDLGNEMDAVNNAPDRGNWPFRSIFARIGKIFSSNC